MTIYRGFGGVNREITQQFRGFGGINREIKEQYRGFEGVNRKVFSSYNGQLYDAGNEYPDITGGFSYIVTQGYPNGIKNANSLYIAGFNDNAAWWVTNNRINKGNYTKLVCICSSQMAHNLSWAGLMLHNYNDSYGISHNAPIKTAQLHYNNANVRLEMNLTDVIYSNFYAMFGFSIYTAEGAVSTELFKMWLE